MSQLEGPYCIISFDESGIEKRQYYQVFDDAIKDFATLLASSILELGLIPLDSLPIENG